MTRVVMADDHPMVREGLRSMLRRHADIEIVGEAAGGVEAVEMVSATRPDVVLLDLRMPDMSGIEVTRQVLALPNAPRVLILTTYDTDSDILGAIEAGASGYLLKDIDPAHLADAIRRTARGETMLASRAATALATSVRAPESAVDLSEQEIRVLSLASQGLTNGHIARIMGIGEPTVKTYLQRAFRKLGAADRTSAVATALSRGIIPGTMGP